MGVLVSPVNVRHPGILAKIVATVDEMSGGRVVVGLGAGWNEPEHAHLGLPFPPIEVRAEMLEEQLAILRGLGRSPTGGHSRAVTTGCGARFVLPAAARPAAGAEDHRRR